MSVLMEFSIFPTDRGESVSAYVSEVIAMIRESGLEYRLTPMGTIVETERLDHALKLIEQAENILTRQGCHRIYAAIKLDIRAGRDGGLKQKITSIEERIGEVKT